MASSWQVVESELSAVRVKIIRLFLQTRLSDLWRVMRKLVNTGSDFCVDRAMSGNCSYFIGPFHYNSSSLNHFLLDVNLCCYLCSSKSLTLLSHLRSKDYGSPNARKRVYIVGVRADQCKETILDNIEHFAQHICPSIHARMSLNSCPLPNFKTMAMKHLFIFCWSRLGWRVSNIQLIVKL